jgi:hypothetical protein
MACIITLLTKTTLLISNIYVPESKAHTIGVHLGSNISYANRKKHTTTAHFLRAPFNNKKTQDWLSHPGAALNRH